MLLKLSTDSPLFCNSIMLQNLSLQGILTSFDGPSEESRYPNLATKIKILSKMEYGLCMKLNSIIYKIFYVKVKLKKFEQNFFQQTSETRPHQHHEVQEHLQSTQMALRITSFMHAHL